MSTIETTIFIPANEQPGFEPETERDEIIRHLPHTD